MTPRQIARQQLHEQLPTLLSGKSVIVLAPLAEADDSIINTVWEFARTVADCGKPAALVDLSLEHPLLESRAQDSIDEGIVDAFLFGASLEHVSRKQGTSGLYFIGAGSATPDPSAVWESERWARLVRGFANQGAILLLFVPLPVVRRMSVTPDLLVVLSGPGGAADQATEVALLEQSGIPLVRINSVRTTEPVALHRTGPAVLTGPEQPLHEGRSGRRWLAGGAVGLTIIVSTALTAVLLFRDGAVQEGRSGSEAVRDSGPPADEAPAQPDTNTFAGRDTPSSVAGTPVTTAPIASLDTTGLPADSLYYAVQVAALSSFSDATAQANRLFDLGFPATVTAFRPDESRVLFRILVGAHATAVAASRMRLDMRERGILGPTAGVLLRTPLALQAQIEVDTAAADATVAGLRDSGTPAYIVRMPGGTVRILTGAFETPEQARLTDSILSTSGSNLSFVLVPRTGTTR